MKRFTCLLFITLTAAFIAGAVEDDDMIMGNYHGAFTSDNWEDHYIRAQVVALSDRAHRLVLFIGETEDDALRLETRGRSEEGVAEFEDTLDLGPLGGDFAFRARIENETMTGVLQEQGGQRLEATFALRRVFIEPPNLGKEPPEGAVSLFDGTNIELWERWPRQWCLRGDGSMEVCGSNLKTVEETFGSGFYHIEFQTPFMPNARGQSRGNSGVYLLGRYEVQVLDSFGYEPEDALCGGVYSLATPIADATLPPQQWQTFEIHFQAPEFNEAGEKIANARIHAYHNGILVHDDVELESHTPGGVSGEEALAGPLLLQDHSGRVRFRNIWFLPDE